MIAASVLMLMLAPEAAARSQLEPAPSQTEPTQTEPTQTEPKPSQAELKSSQTELAQTEPKPSQAEPTQTEPTSSQTEPAQAELTSSQTEPAQTEPKPSQTEPTQTEPTSSQTELASSQTEPAQAELASSKTRSRTEPTVEVATPIPGAGDGRLSRYLQRPVRFGAHFVDHGVLQVAVAGGYPHLYRLELALGVLDHLTLGVSTHWLPGQKTPKISPVIAVAFFRSRLFEVGARHFWSLYPPPVDDFDPATSSYQRSAQWILGTASFGQSWLTGGFDAGVVRARVNDPGMDPEPDATNPSVIRWMFGGGLHLRAGTRRWGFTAQMLLPQLLAEVRFDVRFGLFEKRPRGGWKPYGKAEDWDRVAPW